MFNVLGKLFEMLDRRDRRRLYALLALIVFSGLMDMVGIAGILPFLSVITEPELIRTNATLAWLHGLLGSPDDETFIFYLGCGLFAFLMLSLAVKLASSYAVSRFGHMRRYHTGRRLLAAYMEQPYVWFLRRNSSDLSKIVLHDIDQMIGSAIIPSINILARIVSVAFLVALMIAVEPQVALISAVVLGGTYVLVFLFVRHRLQRIGVTLVTSSKDRFRVTNEALGGIKDVKLMGLEPFYEGRFRPPALRHARALIGQTVISELPRYVLEALTFGGMILIILVLLARADGSLTEILPSLGLFALAGLRLLPAIQRIYAAMTNIRSGTPALDLVYNDLMNMERAAARPAPATDRASASRLPLTRAITLQDVSYGYPGSDQPVVDGLDMTLEARSSIGIVGGTGAGKTTLIDLLLGLLRPDAGRISVDGTELDATTLRAWQNNVGYVPQSIYLVDDTVAANIAFGIPEAERDMAAVERAARLAELHDFVTTELPDGYMTETGERGVRLSGGQRQRIGIARALYHDPEVLILDEATSALDNLTERAVMDAVRNLGHDKTIVMIAHRLSTVQSCDRLYLMERGRIAAQGSYAELIERSETFRDMAAAS